MGQEIYQNIGSSLVAIFFTVLVFLASIRCSIMVILCVGITIVEVAGFMHFWGLTLDVISCNTLVIAVGLCVDFSVHIAHRFLATPGDRSAYLMPELLYNFCVQTAEGCQYIDKDWTSCS